MQESNESKTIIRSNGKIQFFGLKHFLEDIAKGDCCFICGAHPELKEFNNEHIIPDWILKKFKLHSQKISLPNDTKISYSQYKVPCCVDCNSELGKKYEKPISNLLSKSYSEITKSLKNDKNIIRLLFVWINLIYFKTHLKDKNLLENRDTRKGSSYIGDRHYWEDMHHIHCISRSHYTDAKIHEDVYGSLFIFPIIKLNDKEEFDYIDSSNGKTVMLQLGEFCIITVLNDSCAGLSVISDQVNQITGALSPLQVREIVSHLNFVNMNLKERPIFKSKISYKGEYEIIAERPKTWFLLDEKDRVCTPGQFLRFYAERLIGEIDNRELILKEIEEGKRSYMFNEKGEFNDYSKEQ